MNTLQETNISHLEKNHLQKCLGRGYVSCLEGKYIYIYVCVCIDIGHDPLVRPSCFTPLAPIRRLRCPAAVGADSVARPARTTTVTRHAQTGRKSGDIFEKKWKTKKNMLIEPGPTGSVCWEKILQKRALICQGFSRYVGG